MRKNKRSRIIKNLSSSRSGVAIGLSIAGALLCLLPTTFFQVPWENYDNWRIFIVSFFSTLAIVLFASVGWEVIVKKNFAQDVIELAAVSENIRKSGVEFVYEKFSDIDLEWKSILTSSKSIVAVFSYSVEWGKKQASNLKEAHAAGASFTVILPNYEDEEIIQALKFRFGRDKDIRQRIIEAIDFYTKLGATVRLYNGTFTTSYYLIDDIGIMAPFPHQGAAGGHSPTEPPAVKAAESGFIYDFIKSEVSSIMKNSTEHADAGSQSKKEDKQ